MAEVAVVVAVVLEAVGMVEEAADSVGGEALVVVAVEVLAVALTAEVAEGTCAVTKVREQVFGCETGNKACMSPQSTLHNVCE